MSSKEENMGKVKKDLDKLRKNLRKIDAWNTEIEVLKEKMNAYKSGGFGLGAQCITTVTIDDILARDETRLNNLESNIDFTNYKLKEYKAALECLTDNEYEVINRRYLETECKNQSYEGIAKDMKFSKSHIKRLHDSAIEKIVDYKYGSIEIA
ncbi:hypothetical protein EAI30_15240 [Romboutsia ilealis]|uniref:RNA polymerase sigma-70 region 4 domain-containing protein n=1 Tax=Romboutsia faecis TaxID=2764597 RepID=A0ABR7JU73_9FIRM|nr:sigma factor-like helix-turn-helix DNA-binding protein [Romboutsia faecis]MBC5998318.1 hypothetical protein [Romboutsia faecis]MRN25971.1 hypothetical protein [Romboutsia ilealis]